MTAWRWLTVFTHFQITCHIQTLRNHAVGPRRKIEIRERSSGQYCPSYYFHERVRSNTGAVAGVEDCGLSSADVVDVGRERDFEKSEISPLTKGATKAPVRRAMMYDQTGIVMFWVVVTMTPNTNATVRMIKYHQVGTSLYLTSMAA